MTTRTLARLGLGATVGAAACALLTTGLVAPTSFVARTAPLFALPRAAAEELPAFADCAQLRRWYVDRALPLVGPWGFGYGGPMVYLDTMRSAAAVPLAGAATVDTATTGEAVGSSGTGTTVQEAGVDEPDVAKTDGRLLARVVGDRVVLTDVSGARPRTLSATRVPGPRLAAPELLLDGDSLLVLGTERRFWGGPVPVLRSTPMTVDRAALPVGSDAARTHLVRLDVSDPAAPRVTADERVDGDLVSARSYPDGVVRVVVSTGLPPLDFVAPNRDRSRREATRENRRIVRAAPLSAWLPGIRSGAGPKRALVGCDDVRHPVEAAGPGTLSVLTVDPADPGTLDATAVTTAGDLVYSSADRLYVATGGGRGTHVHAFALAGRATRYLTSGLVPGTVRDRWSFSAYDGHLRVATALGGDWAPRENAVLVLDDRLDVVGRLDGLGRRERIQSVRWFGPLAVVVTFRQTDPLYTLDLADPAHPRLLGALKIPGFSSYLHPVGDDLLLGVGQDATTSGAELGAQAAVFDLRDPRRVRRTGVVGLGRDTQMVAGWEPRSFTYLPDRHLALAAVQRWSAYGEHGRLVALRVGPGGTLRPAGSWALHGFAVSSARALPLGGDRVALVDRGVRLLRVG